MRSLWISVVAAALLIVCYSASPHLLRGDTKLRSVEQQQREEQPPKSQNTSSAVAVEKGIEWLVSVQGEDGGWGQDGGETSYVRQGERLESAGNDVANTAVAAQALLWAGHGPSQGKYRESSRRAVEFILRHVEQSPDEGLGITATSGTQIQRKLGPYIDTFLTSNLLSELDGRMPDAKSNERVRRALEKCIAKIESNQLEDGSWNLSGGWAPILGTSLASRSLFVAQQKGVNVEPRVMAKVDEYTKFSARPQDAGALPRGGGGVGGGVFRVGDGAGVAGAVGASTGAGFSADAASAGIALYKGAQVLEQLSRTERDRAKNAAEIAAIRRELSNPRFVEGFGSVGGEEFFSYLNISDSLRRAGGGEWERWNSQTKSRLVTLQNEDGSWAGHHCITGRVAVTSAAVLTLLVENQPLDPAAGRPSRN